MPDDNNDYAPQLKKEVAQQALDQFRKNLDELSDEHDVPVSKILIWAATYEEEGAQPFDKEAASIEGQEIRSEKMDVEITDKEVADAVEYGVMFDDLNYKRLIFWSVFGVLLLVTFVQSLLEMYEYNARQMQQSVSSDAEYYQVNQLKREARNQLNTFGVVDLENNVYRIPIDSAINEMAAEKD